MNARQSICALAMVLIAGTILAAAGDIINTPDEDDGIAPSFRFKAEVPFQSLKEVPIWGEFERMLDDPYATTTCAPDASGQPALGNGQGFPARCTTIQRRRSFLPPGCTYDPTTGLPPCNDSLLPRFVVHPLNYNPSTGEQFRLLNPAFPGVANFANLGSISAGATRIQPGDAPAIDYNSPLTALGGDPGEPSGYANAAVCGNDPIVGWVETRPQCVGNTGLLFDPTIDAATMQPRGLVVSLNKPTIGQAYLVNSEDALAGRAEELAPSNPNDYVRDREMAIALGKALFWDMQLGSDGVQSCASCHFSAGVDTQGPQPVEPRPSGRRHGAGDLSQSPPGHTACARGPERQPRSDRHRLPYAPLDQPRHTRRAAAQPGQRHARHQRRGVVHGHTTAPVQ